MSAMVFKYRNTEIKPLNNYITIFYYTYYWCPFKAHRSEMLAGFHNLFLSSQFFLVSHEHGTTLD